MTEHIELNSIKLHKNRLIESSKCMQWETSLFKKPWFKPVHYILYSCHSKEDLLVHDSVLFYKITYTKAWWIKGAYWMVILTCLGEWIWNGLVMAVVLIEMTRKYPVHGYILSVLAHTTAWDRLWKGDETLKWVSLYVAWLHFTQYRNIRSKVSPCLMDPNSMRVPRQHIFHS